MRPGRQGLVSAARQEFAERGYAAASVRDIAHRAGVSLSALYYWYPGKHDLLAAILDEDLDHYFAAEQLAALVGATVRYRVDHPVRSSVVLSEGRSLQPEQQAAYRRRLDEAADQFRTVIERGVASGEFSTPYPDDARRAIIAACNDITQWYRPDGAIGVDELARRYADLALTIVGASVPARR